MIWFRRLLLLLPGRRRARARELEEELNANLKLALEDVADSGLPPDEARRTAQRDFGNIIRAREEVRGVWFPGWDAFLNDLRLAVRALSRAPVFTAVAVLSLALGIGASAALFSLVNTITLKPLAYREPGQLVFVRQVVPPLAHIYPSLPVNIQHFRYWRDQTRTFDSLAAAYFGGESLMGATEPNLVGSVDVTANFFDVLGVQPQIGRGFLRAEETPGNRAVIITDSLWRSRFAASPSIAGQNVVLGGANYTIVGVLPASFRFPKNTELGPLTKLAERTDVFLCLQDVYPGWGGDYDYVVFGRLRHGFTLGQAVGELNRFEKQIAEAHELAPNLHVEARPLQEVISSPVRTGLVVLLSAVLVLVLLVCVNLASLLLARGSAQAREYAVRVALGASRGRLLFSALVETLVLAVVGGVLGVLAAKAALDAFVRTAPVDLPRLDEVRLDGRVLAFTFALSLFCGLLFGLLPALRISRTDPQATLRGQDRAATPGRQSLALREILVSGEVALTTVLLVLAGLLVSSLWNVLRVERGFTNERSLDVEVSLPSRYNRLDARRAFFDLAAERLRTIPGVHAVAVVSRLPLTGESNVNSVRVQGSEALDPATRELIMVNVRFISQDYFSTLGIPLLSGRVIEAADRDRNVAVISERLAAKLWPNQNPLGRMLTAGSFTQNAEVVGVVGDTHAVRLDKDPTLLIYAPFWKVPHQVSHLVLASAAEPSALTADIRRVLQAIDSGIPAPKLQTMGEIVDRSVSRRRFEMRVAAVFAITALLLAGLGIYGVVAYGISLRRHEFGIRMALGAKVMEVRRLVLWRGLRPVVIGAAIGVVGALATGRFARALLFGVSPLDGLTLATVTAVLGCVGILACLIPARAVSALEPVRLLRNE